MPEMKKGKWLDEEHERLSHAVLEFGTGSEAAWINIQNRVGTRGLKQCKDHFRLSLDPTVVKTEWTQEEDEIVRHGPPGRPLLARRWSQLTHFLPGRHENAIKARFHALARKDRKVWTEEEDALLRSLLKADPVDYKGMHKHFPLKTKFMVQTRRDFFDGQTVVEKVVAANAASSPLASKEKDSGKADKNGAAATTTPPNNGRTFVLPPPPPHLPHPHHPPPHLTSPTPLTLNSKAPISSSPFCSPFSSPFTSPLSSPSLMYSPAMFGDRHLFHHHHFSPNFQLSFQPLSFKESPTPPRSLSSFAKNGERLSSQRNLIHALEKEGEEGEGQNSPPSVLKSLMQSSND